VDAVLEPMLGAMATCAEASFRSRHIHRTAVATRAIHPYALGPGQDRGGDRHPGPRLGGTTHRTAVPVARRDDEQLFGVQPSLQRSAQCSRWVSDSAQKRRVLECGCIAGAPKGDEIAVLIEVVRP
jgi:hypothetical protein